MRVVIQRVLNASVKIDTKEEKINQGYMILLGICNADTKEDIEYLVSKIEKLRIFEDENNKMNLNIKLYNLKTLNKFFANLKLNRDIVSVERVFV